MVMREQSFVRITARPGSSEYRQQFQEQALAAADAALQVGIVRFGCGVFTILLVASLAESIVNFNGACLDFAVSAFNLLVAIPEAGRIAWKGQSLYLRFILSGIPRKACLEDDQNFYRSNE